MINKGQIYAEEIRIQGLVDRFLRVRSVEANFDDGHLDEDSLTAFVEGKISERESPVIVQHLTDCSFCLHITGELAKMNAVFAEEPIFATNQSKDPVKISEVLGGIMSRIFGTTDGAVFAHEEKAEEKESDEDSNEKVQ